MNTKVKHIIDEVERKIKLKVLLQGQQIPSLTEVQQEHKVSRDTANRAYRDLLRRGVIESKKGKGYYVLNDTGFFQVNVFLLLDELSDYKNTLVTSIDQALREKQASYKVFFHHFNEEVFESLIDANLGKFTHYVISPFPPSDTVVKALGKIPSEDLILLDRHDGNYKQYRFVGQEYQLDIIQCLNEIADNLGKYQRFKFVFPHQSIHPDGLKAGFQIFCEQHQMPFEIISNLDENTLEEKEAYLVIEDDDLADILEIAKGRNWKLGQDIGVIAYNNTRLKAAIGITTISTDFKEMGQKLAEAIFHHTDQVTTRNKAQLLKRESF